MGKELTRREACAKTLICLDTGVASVYVIDFSKEEEESCPADIVTGFCHLQLG